MWGILSHPRRCDTSPGFRFCTLWPLLATVAIFALAHCRLPRTYNHRRAKRTNDLWPTSVVSELSPPPARACTVHRAHLHIHLRNHVRACHSSVCSNLARSRAVSPGDALHLPPRPRPAPVLAHPVFVASHPPSLLPPPQVLNVNLKSVWLLSQAAGQHMVPRRRGKVINFCSLLTFQVSTRSRNCPSQLYPAQPHPPTARGAPLSPSLILLHDMR